MARKRGRGMAACWYGIARTAVIDRAAAWAEIDDGGSAKIVTGVTEIGEGILTVRAQIAAHEMGVKPEHVVMIRLARRKPRTRVRAVRPT
jgi:CO/xanthine dehydrogenase Mo-binding subunit